MNKQNNSMMESTIDLQEVNLKLDRLLEERQSGPSSIIWTNKEVCIRLNVSSKTLKSYRDRGLITFSQVRRKFFYKPEDVASFIEKSRYRSIHEQAAKVPVRKSKPSIKKLKTYEKS